MNRPVSGTDDLYDLLLMDYAAGGLDGGLSLVVASHLTLSPAARRQMEILDRLGGALLQECCGSIAMNANSLTIVLERLDEGTKETPPSPPRDFGCCLPAPLHRHLSACRQTERRKGRWKQATEAMTLLPVPVAPAHARGLSYRAFIVRVLPGATFSTPSCARSYVLVLEGSLHTETGVFTVGQLLIFEKNEADLTADAADGCTCLIMREDMSIGRWLRGLLQDLF